MRLSPTIVVCALVSATPALAQRAPNLADLDARLAALEARLGELVTTRPDLGSAIAEVESAVAALRQDVDELKKAYAGDKALVARIDAIDQKLAELSERTASLRADLESRTSPEAASRGGGAGIWADGFRLVDEPAFAMRVHGLVQLRHTWLLAEAAREGETLPETLDAGFSLRRLRLAFDGRAYSPRLRYFIQLELAGQTQLLDGWLEGDLPAGFFLRGGQQKVPFSRSFIGDDGGLVFLERPVATDELRHDRDLGLVAGWRGWARRLELSAGVLNGGGIGKNRNDNRDPLLVARAQLTPFGEPFAAREGDLGRTAAPALAIGAGVTFENAPVPGLVGYGPGALREGVDLDVDVDGDGSRDNVQVLMFGADLAFRWLGLGIEAEVHARQEDWGVIDDAQTPSVDFEASRWYVGGYAQATYLVLPRLVVGGRFARSEVSPLLLGRVRSVAPVDERRWEATALVSYHRFANGIELTGMYSFLDWTDRTVDVGTDDVGSAGEGEQRLLVEAQVSF